MKIKTKNILNHSVVKNASWIAALQVLNYISPLIVLPHIARALTIAEFGIVMVVMSTIAMAVVVTEYGFGLSASYKIAVNRDDKKVVEQIMGKIFTAKIGLSVIGVGIILVISSLNSYKDYQNIFLAGILAMIAQTYHSAWVYQGLEKMNKIIVYLAGSKLLYVGLVIGFVTDSSDPAIVIWCWSFANAIGMIAALMGIKRMGYKLTFAPYKDAISEIKESAQFFWSRVAVSMYTTASSVVVGAVGLNQAALYTTAEQGYKAGQAFTASIAQALYPYMARERDWKVFIKIVLLGFIVISVGAICVGLFSKQILEIIFGKNYIESAEILKIMMVTLVVNYLGVCLGYPAFAATKKISIANKTVIHASALFGMILVALWFIDAITALNVTVSVMFVELFVLIVRYTALSRLRNNG